MMVKFCLQAFLILSVLRGGLAGVPSSEINFLQELYQATGGDTWKWRPTFLNGPPWNFTVENVNPCNTNAMSWQGLDCNFPPELCDTQECHIIALALELYGLEGTLPDQWGELTGLTFLDLSLNQLEGSFPQTLIPPVQIHSLFLEVNNLTGTLPGEVFSSMTSLVFLDLSNNDFTGSIPTEIGSLTLLEHFEFRLIDVTGGIPSSIGNLGALTLLDLSGSYFTGTMPTAFGQLTSMIFMDLDFNALTGTIPPELGLLENISFLDFSSNSLTGPIPSTLGSLTALTTLNLHYNNLNGTIPPELGSLVRITNFWMADNLLTGSIPSSIGNFRSASSLDLLSNFLTGEIPMEISQLTQIEILNLGGNYLSGTIPSAIGGLSRVSWLNLMMNSFTGTIPSELGALRFLRYFYLGFNFLSGPLVCDISQFLSLVILDYQRNALTGPLCSTFSPKLIDMHLNSNFFTGTISSGVGVLKNLGILQLDHNLLEGRIPDTVRNMTSLFSLSLSQNHLSHSIPSGIGCISSLKQLYLQSNHLHGTLDAVVCQPSNLTWTNLDLSDNILSGSIPSQLFHISSLASIILTSNCFGGSLTSDICLSRELNVLSLDGLGASHECPNSDLFSFQRQRLLDGSIPSCLWSLLNLTSVSLSGNGFTGTLGILPSGSNLENLTLSHNQLSGTIPKSFQNHPFRLLDLSYNRFNGEVGYLTPTRSLVRKSHFILEVNRLSGRLNSFQKFSESEVKLDLLTGNLFSCDGLPDIDQSYGEYLCASEDLDRSLILFGAIVLVIVLLLASLLLLIRLRCHTFVPCKWLNTIPAILRQAYQSAVTYLSAGTGPLVVRGYLLQLRRISIVILLLTLVGILLLLPLHILKAFGGEGDDGDNSSEYSTHTHLYRWMLTVAYSTGVVPAALLLFAWAISISVFIFSFGAIARAIPSALNPNPSPPVWKDLPLSVGALLCLDLLILGGVNASYIYSTTQDITTRNQLAIKLLIAIFTFLWSEGFSRSSHVALNISYAIIKTIVIPCLATALTSPSCFQTLLVPPPKITTYYEYLACDTYVIINYEDSSAVVCSDADIYYAQVIPFRPPFFFNFVCFSTILTAYIPVFLYTYCLKIAFPILMSLFLAKVVDYDNLPTQLRTRTRGILWPSHWSCSPSSALRSEDNNSPEHSPLSESLLQNKDRTSRSTLGCNPHATQEKEFATPDLLFKPSRVFGSITQDFCVLFTFGLCSPILAVAVALNSTLTILHTKIIISRFISHRKLLQLQQRPPQDDDAVTALERSLSMSGIIARDDFLRMVWPIVWSSCFFIAFLGWEISGDSTGWKKSIWVPISAVMIAITVQIVTTTLPAPNLLTSFLLLLDHSFSMTPLATVEEGDGRESNPLATEDPDIGRGTSRSDGRRSSVLEMT